jgi:hypothetical protein
MYRVNVQHVIADHKETCNIKECKADKNNFYKLKLKLC